jgi:hypothetical protein
VVTGKPNCIDIDSTASLTAQPLFNSVAFGCATTVRDDTDVTAAQVLERINAGQNNRTQFTVTLVDRFINGTNEAAVPATNPTAPAIGGAFFQNLDFIGAVQNAADTTFRGWTCSLYSDGPAC